jgi:hypothetical protein
MSTSFFYEFSNDIFMNIEISALEKYWFLLRFIVSWVSEMCKYKQACGPFLKDQDFVFKMFL